mmetsp:Transcript_16836/g.21290  ORF Transcript_16836/g.21290 Transcript_16836/m.21290 type:complete len:607 (-) Transcript_16836:50-1870(-)
MMHRKKVPLGSSKTSSSRTTVGASSTRMRRKKKKSRFSKTVDYIVMGFVMVIFGAFMYEFGVLHAENVADGTASVKNGSGKAGAINKVKGVIKAASKNLRRNISAHKSSGSGSGVVNLDDNLYRSDLSHLQPPVPYLPIFASIPNDKQLIQDTLDGTKPTIAGIVALLQKFLSELHDKNMMLSQKRADGDEIIDAFFTLAKEHLLPFDKAYRGRPIFPIREDESIFLSLAAFREHLLADTLAFAFDNAKHPDKLFVGAVVQNCFGKVLPDGTIDPSGTPCKTGAQVVGKNKQGRDMTKVSDAPIDKNGIEDFCNDPKYEKYCKAGQVRAVYVHETESLGPAMARYYASKLWGGETYFVQTDSHLKFAEEWDEKYRIEVKAAKNYPKAILSSYPPGFTPGSGTSVHESNGAKLCFCETNVLDPNPIIRINAGGNYKGGEKRPTQIPFVAAGFFFARAEFLVDMPFDPLIPWCFMGEEIALSLRSWTSGWSIYAPRKNLIAHQYRPGRMGLPKFWGSVGRLYGRPQMNNKIQGKVIKRLKNLAGYPDATVESIQKDNIAYVLTDMEYYGVGKERTLEQYMEFAGIHVDKENNALACKAIPWCGKGLKE